MARSVEDRIAYMADPRNWPGRPNRCAETTWLALGVPRLGAATAAIAASKIEAAGHMHHDMNPPRGAVVLWRGGHSGAGHMAMSLGRKNGVVHILSTDVTGPGRVGEVPLSWFAAHWPAEHWVGWSDWYTVPLPMHTHVVEHTMTAAHPRSAEVTPMPVDDFLSLKATDKITIHTGADVALELDHHTQWRAEVPSGRHILALYANIDLPAPGTPVREALARGGWRAWFQQTDTHEVDHRDETGYLGYIPVSSHAPGNLLISHSWPHGVDESPWEFMIRLEAIGPDGRPMHVPLVLATREIKVIGRA